jgi:putative phage-type endonuclease
MQAKENIEQLGDRTKYIGASNVAAICGVSDYANAYDVWLEKTGQLEKPERSEEWLADGRRLEPIIIDWAEEQIGPLTRKVEIAFPHLNLIAHLDAQSKEGYPIEAKTSGISAPLPDTWGDAGTDQIPTAYIIQTHAQMLASGSDLAFVPALLGGRGKVMYRVERNNELMEFIFDTLEQFNALVAKGKPPENITPHLDVVKYVRRSPRTTVVIDMQVVNKWKQLRDERIAIQKREDEAKAKLLTSMKDCESAQCNGAEVATFKKQFRKSFNAKKFQMDHPEIWKEYQYTFGHRVLRHKSVKQLAQKGN